MLRESDIEYCLLTGATGAIGREIAKALARCGVPLILACRNMEKAENLRKSLPEDLPVRLLSINLASEDSVREAVVSLEGVRLCGLINNAGVMMRHYETDASGREMTLAVNFYNTRLLTDLLLPSVVDGGAVVFTTSLTRFMGRRKGYSLDIRPETFSQMGAYSVSKKAITDYACNLSQSDDVKQRGLRVNCADPGVVDTGMITLHRWFDPLADLFFRPFIRKPSSGAVPALRAYNAPSGTRGKIFCRRRIHEM